MPALTIIRSSTTCAREPGKISVARTFNLLNMGVEGSETSPTAIRLKDSTGTCGRPRSHAAVPSKIIETSGTHSAFMAYSGGWSPCWARTSSTCPSGRWTWGCPRWSVRRVVGTLPGRGRRLRYAGDCPAIPQLHPHLDDVADQQLPVRPEGRVGIYFHGVNGTLYADYGTKRSCPKAIG